MKGPCILWNGAKTKKGYGVRRFRGHNTTAHRAAWIEKHGPIGSRWIFVLHKCDNPPCVNIDHLFLGTNTDNMRDASRKGRLKGLYTWRVGERAPRAIMTDIQVVAARALRHAGRSNREIANAMGVPYTDRWKFRIQQATSGRTFKHLPL